MWLKLKYVSKQNFKYFNIFYCKNFTKKLFKKKNIRKPKNKMKNSKITFQNTFVQKQKFIFYLLYFFGMRNNFDYYVSSCHYQLLFTKIIYKVETTTSYTVNTKLPRFQAIFIV